MTTLNITPVGSEIPVAIDKKDFLGALENCDNVNNIITINGLQYSLNTVEFGAVEPKKYRALMTSTGTAAPVAVVLENTTGEALTWGYLGVGDYFLHSPNNIFVDNKVYIDITANNNNFADVAYDLSGGGQDLEFKTYQNNVLANGSKFMVTVYVYP